FQGSTGHIKVLAVRGGNVDDINRGVVQQLFTAGPARPVGPAVIIMAGETELFGEGGSARGAAGAYGLQDCVLQQSQIGRDSGGYVAGGNNTPAQRSAGCRQGLGVERGVPVGRADKTGD